MTVPFYTNNHCDARHSFSSWLDTFKTSYRVSHSDERRYWKRVRRYVSHALRDGLNVESIVIVGNAMFMFGTLRWTYDQIDEPFTLMVLPDRYALISTRFQVVRSLTGHGWYFTRSKSLTPYSARHYCEFCERREKEERLRSISIKCAFRSTKSRHENSRRDLAAIGIVV